MTNAEQVPAAEADERAERAARYVEFRQFLVAADQKSQDDFDRTVLTLSGGALGISFAFLKDVIGETPITAPYLLIGAWGVWGLSMLCVLVSYFCSHMAIRRMIDQIDKDTYHKDEKKGGRWRDATSILNISGALFFIAGVVLITLFATMNLQNKERVKSDNSKATDKTASSTPGPASTAKSPASATHREK